MAKSSDEIERELELKRQKLHVRVNELRGRVAGNVRGMRDQTQHELKSYVHTAEAQVVEHPWLAIAGGFGSGVALGVARPGGGGHASAARNESNGQHGESLLSKGVSTLFSATSGPVLDELRGTLQDTLSELKGTLQDSVSDVVHGITGSNGNGSNASQHRQRVRDHAA
jgi:ElaB/YqjD/DUF883 family membrane-anchored ribosome-binding protein